MQKVITLLVLLSACAQAQTQYTGEQVKKDISYLHAQLEKYHPGFYRYTPKEEMDQLFTEASESHGLNDIGVYQKVNALLSKIGCGHTRSRMSDNMREQFELHQRFLPISLKFLGDKVYVRKSLDKQVKEGMELIAINDKKLEGIKKTIYQYLPSDGYIETGKKRMTELLFNAYYQLYIDSTATDYTLDLRNSEGENLSIVVDGVSAAELNTIQMTFSGDYLQLEKREEYAYLRIRTFSASALNAQGYDYEKFLANSFQSLKADEIEHLVLDLRGNGGGKDTFGALLVSYLAKEPFGYFDRIEVTKKYPGKSDRVGDQFRMTNHKGLEVWKPQPDRFTGKVYVLIDGLSFSTCADVATVLHHHRWATFLGEETGGGYDGNTSGHTRNITLPHSGIKVNVPMWKYTTANIGHAFPGRGVIPDYQVKPTWESFSAGEDQLLKRVEQLINK